MRNTYLSLGDQRLDGGPRLALGSIAEQVHDDSAALDGICELEQVLAGHPAILDGLLPRSTVLSHADDHVEAIVAQVETLAVALGAVANEGEGIIFEIFLDNC